jgi:hypothetical protein
VNDICRKHLRSAWLTACSAIVLALAGCGGDGEANNAAEPRIDSAVATQLADASDEVAQLVEEGNVCEAAERADELLLAAETEVENGTVPPELAGPLLENARALQNEINCDPPMPPPPPPETETHEGDD